MKSHFSYLLAPLFVCNLLMPTTATAGDCSFLKRDPLELRDRQVFFQIKGEPAWSSLDGSALDLADKDVSYAYVIRETIDPARNGVVILKSARLRQLAETSKPRYVLLVRHADGADNKSCGIVSEFGEHPVLARSYDDFHDHGLAVPEIKTIRAFHIRYAGRLNHCRRTDDNGPDSLVPRDGRSNRGQFSFDPTVVSRETYSQVLALAGSTNAYAQTDNLIDQRVEVKQYQVSNVTPTCVRFTLRVQGQSNFLRINDLEALTRTGGGTGYTRSSEQSWSLSQ